MLKRLVSDMKEAMALDEHLKSIVECEGKLFNLRNEKWITHDIFSVRWWVLVGFLILPWIIWFLLVDKKRLQEMIIYTFATSFIAILLDEMGTTLTFWAYPINIVPTHPRLLTVNYAFVPIFFTLVYQHFPKWKTFIVVNIIISFIFSLVMEPILVWAKLYVLISWKFMYSIPIYFFTAVILKWVSERIIYVQYKN